MMVQQPQMVTSSTGISCMAIMISETSTVTVYEAFSESGRQVHAAKHVDCDTVGPWCESIASAINLATKLAITRRNEIKKQKKMEK
ncbi:MAG: hypothetical protein FWE64_01925 [Alphaproteobacteria bacterium]|nr:hypothetical protein [Alphaproteobacteria bacterium]